MHRLFITAVFLLGLILSAHGLSVEISVTPTNLDQYKYVFVISTNAAPNGVAFHVAITAKREDISSDSTAGLSIVTHKNEGGNRTHSIEGVKPAIPVVLKKESRVWKADFTVSHDLLKKPGLCFVFTERAHANIDGKSVAMESADFYEIKLQDFLKR
ncbi:MAG: hypothetical protein ABI042_07005 [Verrucomicrobiota bacterium]